MGTGSGVRGASFVCGLGKMGHGGARMAGLPPSGIIFGLLLAAATAPTPGVPLRPADPAAAADGDLARSASELGSQQFRVRQRASAALLRAGERALPHVLDALSSRDAEVSRRAMDLVLAICRSAEIAPTLAARDAVARTAETRDHPAARRAASLLAQLDQQLERRAAEALEKQGAVVYQAENAYRVSLGDNYRGGTASLAVLRCLPRLVFLHVQGAEIGDEALAHVRRQGELESLALLNVPVSDAGLAHLAGLKNLRSLHLTRTRVTSAGLAHLEGLSQLADLRLDGHKDVTDGGLRHLSNLAQLKNLDLSGTGISDQGLCYLKGLRGIESLRLNGTNVSGSGLQGMDLGSLKQLGLESTAVGDGSLEILRRVSPDFFDLNLQGTSITDAGLVHLRPLKQLLQLDLSRTRITDAGLAHLEPLERLRMLALSGTQVQGRGFRHLKARQLGELHLEDTPVDDEGLEQLQGRAVRLLALQRTRVTDRGLSALKNIAQLQFLRLDGTRVTAAGMVHLAPLQDLRELSLVGTAVPPPAVQQLQKAIFKCTIRH